MPPSHIFQPNTPLSLVIGVTGHRDLRDEDIPQLESALGSALQDIRRKYPASSAIMLSTLAEGADRLAARVALEAGMRLVVPLPLPQPLYETDFERAASCAEFRELLGRASGVLRLPLLPGVDEEDVRKPGQARDREYAKAGAYLTRHSQIFFALWDGVADKGDKVGGTAQTVRFRLEGTPAPYATKRGELALNAATGPVVHLETPRKCNPDSGSLVCGAAHALFPDGVPPGSFEQICRRIDEFNSDAWRFHAELGRAAETSTAYLLNADPNTTAALLSSLPSPCRRITEQYAAADALALHFQIRALSTWKQVPFGVVVAAVLFNVHAAFFSVQSAPPASVGEEVAALPWFLIAFLGWSAFTAVWLYGRARRGEYQTKYQDCRALAEALRIRFFWSIAGLDEPVVDSYLRKQRSELEWIRSALLSCDVWVAAGGPSPDATLPLAERLGLVSRWVRDQRRYFAARATSESAKLEKETKVIEWLLKTSGALSVALALLLAIPLVEAARPGSGLMWMVPADWVHRTFMLAIPVLAVAAGLVHGYGKQLARSEHIRQFGRMSELFYVAEQKLDTLLADNQEESAALLVRELGLEALDEISDWLILHRERPLEVPPG